MPESKLTSCIQKVELNAASFVGTNESFQPSLVNLFYGSNGTGKSTIATTLSTGNGCHLEDGIDPRNLRIYLYDQRYINDNFQNFRGLPGVFNVDKVNVELQQKIDELETQKKAIDQEITLALEKHKELKDNENKPYQDFKSGCWERNKDIKNDFYDAFVGYKKSEAFAKQVLSLKVAEDHDLTEIRKLYDIAYGKGLSTYPLFPIYGEFRELDYLGETQLFSKHIISHADSEFAQFLNHLNAIPWIKDAHERFHPHTDGKCPYCQRELPENFEEELAACFDEEYSKDLHALEDLRDSYVKAANRIVPILQNIPSTTLPEINLEQYNDKITILDGTIRKNLDAINSKINDPTIEIGFEPTEPTLREIHSLATEFNRIIENHNNIIKQRQQKKKECQKLLWELIAYREQEFIKQYKSQVSDRDTQIKDLVENGKNLRTQSNALQTQLDDLRRSTINTSGAVASINRILTDTGFQGFRLEESKTDKNVYSVIREDGTVAVDVSEGEKNFIAFLYFYHQVMEQNPEDKRLKIVILDDPVSSLDSKAVHVVAGITREMIQICENNSGLEGENSKSNFIKQFFFLTHNIAFFNAVTRDQITENRYRYVNFYKLTKQDNRSAIKLCTTKNPDRPTELINASPVHNSYVALWEDFIETKNPVVLINVIRQILDTYFVQNCCMTGSFLTDKILNDHRDEFIYDDENGTGQHSAIIQARAMLSYLCTESKGIFDSIHYVDEGLDTDLCRKAFKTIFKVMGQEQHYNLMYQRAQANLS